MSQDLGISRPRHFRMSLPVRTDGSRIADPGGKAGTVEVFQKGNQMFAGEPQLFPEIRRRKPRSPAKSLPQQVLQIDEDWGGQEMFVADFDGLAVLDEEAHEGTPGSSGRLL